MKTKLACLCALLLSSALSFAQEETNEDIPDVTNVTKATFLNPGLSYETRIAKFQTLYLQAFLNTSAYFSYSSSLGTSSGIGFDPALTGQYRYYYNAARRQSKEKRTDLNSLNYLGGVWQTVFTKAAMTSNSITEDKRRPVHTFGIVWGLQRNYGSRFSLDLNLGYGFFATKGTELDSEGHYNKGNQTGFTTVGQLNLGFWLNKRR